MMEGTYYKEWSTALGREMEFKVYGSAGVPVLAFPCGGGRFYDWEDHGMPEAAGWLIEHGRVQLFCADSIDQDSFLAEGLSPRRRAEMQEKYFCYVTGELVPRIQALNAAAGKAAKPAGIWAVGADQGAYQAVNCRLRRPELFCGAIGLSGLYDPSARLGGPEDDLALRNDPLAALVSEFGRIGFLIGHRIVDKFTHGPIFALIVLVVEFPVAGGGHGQRFATRIPSAGDNLVLEVVGHPHDVLHHGGDVGKDILVFPLEDIVGILGRNRFDDEGIVDKAFAQRADDSDFAVNLELLGDST